MLNHICERCGVLWEEHVEIITTFKTFRVCPTALFLDSGQSVEVEEKKQETGEPVYIIKYWTEGYNYYCMTGGNGTERLAHMDTPTYTKEVILRFGSYDTAVAGYRDWLSARKREKTLPSPTTWEVHKATKVNDEWVVEPIKQDLTPPKKYVVRFKLRERDTAWFYAGPQGSGPSILTKDVQRFPTREDAEAHFDKVHKVHPSPISVCEAWEEP
jgi:hypothetical protein